MYRGKVMVTAAAVFAIGAAFAAQPTSIRADRLSGQASQHISWAPGTNGVMSSFETAMIPVAPPQ
jgi:hypothetical protein